MVFPTQLHSIHIAVQIEVLPSSLVSRRAMIINALHCTSISTKTRLVHPSTRRPTVVVAAYKLNINKAVVCSRHHTPHALLTRGTHTGQEARGAPLQVCRVFADSPTPTTTPAAGNWSSSRQVPCRALQRAKPTPCLQVSSAQYQSKAYTRSACTTELGIKTIGDLGQWKYFQMAKTIATLATVEEADKRADANKSNLNLALDAAHEQASFAAMLTLPPSALQGLTDRCVGP